MTGKRYAALVNGGKIAEEAYNAGMEYGAITFSKWLSQSGYVMSTNNLWVSVKDADMVSGQYSTEQLYRTFKMQLK